MTKDKLQHIAICFIASFYSTELAIGIAVTKEWCDMKVYAENTAKECVKDFLADVVGIILGTLVRLLIINRWNWL